MTTKIELEKEIQRLQARVATLSEKNIAKSTISATRSAVLFLKENIDQIVAIDMDTSYGHVTFKLKR